MGWFFAVLTRKCGYTFDQGVWSCSGIGSYTAEAVVVVESIVSLLASTARKMQIMGNMQSGSVLDELDELPADLADVLEEGDEDGGKQSEQGGQAKQGSAAIATQSQATCAAVPTRRARAWMASTRKCGRIGSCCWLRPSSL